MLFSSLIFLYGFLPIVLLLYYLLPFKGKNVLLMATSLLFYAWGGVSLTAIFIVSVIGNYFLGIWIDSSTQKRSKIPLIIGIVFNLFLLTTFKYGNFIVETLNTLFAVFHFSPIKNPGIVLPLGISFFTFHAMSYIIDVYRRVSPVQKNLFYLTLYLSFFPQLIAGPIVRYHDLAPQILSRKENIQNFSNGIERLIIGLFKKVVIANQFAVIAKDAFQISPDILPQQLAWAGMICYSFQIYFDFAGYSDMAVGLGLMFGFKLPENFNFPYSATSIRKFWKNWHITLGQWLMDYLYVPLGGNRGSNARTYMNLLVVFIVCGFWHGASWNFLLWGLIHGLFMAFERYWFEEKVLNKLGSFIPMMYTFTIATFAWVLFETADFQHTIGYFNVLFLGNDEFEGSNYLGKIFNWEFLLIAIPSILGSFGLFRWGHKIILERYPSYDQSVFVQVLKILGLVLTMGIITILLISDTYNPFIYFRF